MSFYYGLPTFRMTRLSTENSDASCFKYLKSDDLAFTIVQVVSRSSAFTTLIWTIFIFVLFIILSIDVSSTQSIVYREGYNDLIDDDEVQN